MNERYVQEISVQGRWVNCVFLFEIYDFDVKQTSTRKIFDKLQKNLWTLLKFFFSIQKASLKKKCFEIVSKNIFFHSHNNYKI